MTRISLPPSSVAFDWLMGCFSVLVMAGVFQDGWAHNHGLVDQSFLTPWHAILYGTVAISGLALLAVGVRNLLRGYSLRNGLPAGYWTSATGVIVFILGGGFDTWWHTKFGIETDIQGLVSPSHLLLAFGGTLIFAGVFRSIAMQYGEFAGGWKRIGPAVLAGLAMLMLLGFFTQYAQPFADDTMLSIVGPVKNANGGALYSVNADGSRETRIATVSGQDLYGATVSPDGKRIAYRRQAAGDFGLPSDIWVANADGTHAVRITHSGRHDTQPAWSPDGTRIAFISMPAGTSGNFRLQTVRPNGTGMQTLVDGVTTIGDPAWSPDSRFLAFSSRNGLTAEIAVIPSGGGPQRWWPSTAGGSTASWSKNGLAFQTADGNIAVTNGPTAQPRIVADSASAPQWSSDGRRLAYLAAPGADTQVFISRADGSAAADVSQLSGLDATHVSWGPGAVLFFSAGGRAPAAQTGIGRAYGIDAAIVSSIALMGILLLYVRRWRAPFGTVTILLGVYSVALATQTDLYFAVPAALATAIAADLALAAFGERARSGVPLYVFSFALPFVLFALYLESVRVHLGGLGWPGNIALGTPLIAGVAGLLVSFCYAAPLSLPQTAADSQPAQAGVTTVNESPAADLHPRPA